MPTVSIITPAFNSSRFLGETIASVRKQTFSGWEMIIVDDCSTDDTYDLACASAQSDCRIRVFRNGENKGPGPSRNRAVQKASGRYIAFLDSDDIWAPEKLERQLRHIEQTKAPLVFSSYGTIDESGNNIDRIVGAPDSVSYAQLMENTVIGCLTVLVDRQRVPALEMPAIPSRQPLVLWLRILRECGPARGLDKVLAYYRIRPGSVSGNKMKAARQVWRVYRDFEKLSLWYSSYYFIHYAINGILRNKALRR